MIEIYRTSHRISTPTGQSMLWMFCFVTLLTASSYCQQVCPRLMDRDTTLNNLVDPPGYKTARLGTLGSVKASGTGDTAMIIIPGLGFGGDVFEDFAAKFSDRYRVYTVTLAGFGGTPAPPSPPESVSFGAQTWTNGALEGIEKLINDEKLTNIVIVGHWLTGTQLAIRLGIEHPQIIRAIVLLTAAPVFNVTDSNYAKYYETYEKRVTTMDKLMGGQWFKYVTRATWDDNNFYPTDYAVHPVLGLRMWREAARPDLHVWVRYLCEFEAQDITREISKLKQPALILNPGYEDLWVDHLDYMRETFGYKGWGQSLDGHSNISSKTIPNSRCCMWKDQPEEVEKALKDFLAEIK